LTHKGMTRNFLKIELALDTCVRRINVPRRGEE
jgi:hypothetical protein